MPRGNEPLGDIASVVLFENELVKIWNLIVEPGEASDWHFHERDYVTVVVEGGGLTVEFDDGSSGEGSSQVGTWLLPQRSQGAPRRQQHQQPLQERIN